MLNRERERKGVGSNFTTEESHNSTLFSVLLTNPLRCVSGWYSARQRGFQITNPLKGDKPFQQ